MNDSRDNTRRNDGRRFVRRRGVSRLSSIGEKPSVNVNVNVDETLGMIRLVVTCRTLRRVVGDDIRSIFLSRDIKFVTSDALQIRNIRADEKHSDTLMASRKARARARAGDGIVSIQSRIVQRSCAPCTLGDAPRREGASFQAR